MPLYSMLSCPNELLDEVVFGDEPDETQPWLHAKIDGMLFSHLGVLLGAGTYDELCDEFLELISDPMCEWRYLFRVPITFSDAVSRATPDTLDRAAREWVSAEGFAGRAKPDALASYLETLREFFRSNEGPFFLVVTL